MNRIATIALALMFVASCTSGQTNTRNSTFGPWTVDCEDGEIGLDKDQSFSLDATANANEFEFRSIGETWLNGVIFEHRNKHKPPPLFASKKKLPSKYECRENMTPLAIEWNDIAANDRKNPHFEGEKGSHIIRLWQVRLEDDKKTILVIKSYCKANVSKGVCTLHNGVAHGDPN